MSWVRDSCKPSDCSVLTHSDNKQVCGSLTLTQTTLSDGFAYPQNVVYMFRVKNRCCVANIIHLKEYEKNMVVE